MAFKLNKNPTFVTKVTIAVPTDEGFVDETLSVRFKVVGDAAWEMNSPEFLREVILRIDGVLNDDDEPVASSGQLIEDVLALPFTRLPMVKAYMQAVTGARVGNLAGQGPLG